MTYFENTATQIIGLASHYLSDRQAECRIINAGFFGSFDKPRRFEYPHGSRFYYHHDSM